MEQTISNPGEVLILERGEELISTLEEYALANKIPSAWLKSGLGGAKGATLSFYDIETREYVDKTFDQPIEVLSLQGNLTWVEEKPHWHIHGIFSTRDCQTIGGHIKALNISLTAELFVIPMTEPLTRRYDKATGLKLIERSKLGENDLLP